MTANIPKIFVAAVLSLWTIPADAATLTVIIENISKTDGHILLGLYNDADAFPSGQRFRQERATPTVPRVTVEFADVPPGDYAISAFHDVNDKGKIEANYLGIPIVPYGISNNARGQFGPPLFADAHFHIGEQSIVQRIELR
jgi:uncharacterized protein (DUF2141 family)